MRDGGLSAVIFDVGNVLYRWTPDAFLALQIPDDEARRRFVAQSRLYEWHDGLDGGRPFDEAARELSAQFPAYAGVIAAWGARFGETIEHPMPDMPALVAQLDARGVPLFGITNFSADFWPPFRTREAAFFDRFRDIVVSGEENVMKPDPAIYRLALARFGLRPDEALFVDDRQINVDGAEAIGIRSHLFVGADDLRARLEAEDLLA